MEIEKLIQLIKDTHPRPAHVTQKQAAEMLGKSAPTIREMIKDGKYIFYIEVEKMLLDVLGREWKPSGFSIETLLAEIKKKLSAYKPQAVLSGQGLVIEMPQVDDVLEQAAQAIDALASSGENKDDWTITRDLAFHRASEAVRALIVKPQADDVRKDAERYRFLREGKYIHNGEPFIARNFGASFSQWTSEDADKVIDQAIDKARE